MVHRFHGFLKRSVFSKFIERLWNNAKLLHGTERRHSDSGIYLLRVFPRVHQHNSGEHNNFHVFLLASNLHEFYRRFQRMSDRYAESNVGAKIRAFEWKAFNGSK